MNPNTRTNNTAASSRYGYDSPLRSLLVLLPLLQLDDRGSVDAQLSDASLLLSIAAKAEEAAACINRGLSAIGCLLAYSTPEIEDGTIPYDAIEALGWLFAELGAVTAHCIELSARCRQASSAQYSSATR